MTDITRQKRLKRALKSLGGKAALAAVLMTFRQRVISVGKISPLNSKSILSKLQKNTTGYFLPHPVYTKLTMGNGPDTGTPKYL